MKKLLLLLSLFGVASLKEEVKARWINVEIDQNTMLDLKNLYAKRGGECENRGACGGCARPGEG